MKITHCIYSFNTGGAETMLVDIMNEQVKEHIVQLVVLNNSYSSALLSTIDKRVEVICLDRSPGSRNPWPLVRLNYLLRREKPDAIHLHSSTLSSFIFGQKNKLFYTCHAMGIQFSPAHFRKIFAISEAVAEDLKRRLAIKNVVVVPNGICCDKVKRRNAASKTPSSPFRLVNVARLDHEKKGQDILIKAVAQLKEEGVNNITVDFIGEGASLSFLQELATSLGVHHQIRFLGLKDRQYIYEHLADYDLMCHPSRYEGFGLTVAEGMAAGLPVLVSNNDGPYEIIAQGRYGYAFEQGSVEDCAKSLRNLLKDHKEALIKAQDGALHVNKLYSLQLMTSQYTKVYIEAVG